MVANRELRDRTIFADVSMLERTGEVLKNYPAAAAKVVNRTLARLEGTVRTESARQIPKVFGLPSKEVSAVLQKSKRRIKSIVGGVGEGSLAIQISGNLLTATRFRHTPTRPPAAGKRGRRKVQPTLTVYLNGGKKPLQPVLGMDGKRKPIFLAKRPGAEGYFLYHRTGQKNQQGKEKLEVLHSLSVPQMVVVPQVAEPLTQKVLETAEKRLTHELDYEFGQLGSYLAGKG